MWPDSVIVLAKMIFFYGLSCFMIFRVRGWSRVGSPHVSCIIFIWFESKWLTTFRIATCLLYYYVWWDMMFDSFSAPFPTWNTHPIRISVTLLSNAHLHRLLLQRPLVITVHSLRQVHSTGHSECLFIVRRSLMIWYSSLAGQITHGLSVPSSAGFHPSIHTCRPRERWRVTVRVRTRSAQVPVSP